MCARWALTGNGDMGVCWMGGCHSAMETWVCAGSVLVRNGDGVCVGRVLIGNEDMCVCLTTMEAAEVSHCMASDQPNNEK